MSFGGPILLRVEPTDAGGTGAAVKLTWRNPMNYNSVEIWRSKSNPQDPYDKGNYLRQPIKGFTSSDAETKQGSDKTFIDTGLDPHATYGYYLRGYPE